MRRFHAFCVTYNVWDPFPLTEHLLCSFVAFLADQGLAPQTGKSYLAALRSMQISLGLPDPRDQSSLPILKRVLAGISRARAQSGLQPRIRLPITIQVLARINTALSESSRRDKVVLWAVAASAFFGFFRLGELLPVSTTAFNPSTQLSWGDVSVDSHTEPSMVQFHLKVSKCDQFGAGAFVVVGRIGCTLCPVQALLQYIDVRGTSPGPFFLDGSRRPLCKSKFIGDMREILQSVGLPHHQYAGHSFRIGAATTAAAAGVPDSMIQTLGRWHSAAFLRYIRTPKEELSAISAMLSGSIRTAD